MANKKTLSSLYKRMIIIGVLLVLGSLYFRSVTMTLGVVAGLILAVVNLWLIQRTVGGLLAGQRTSLRGLYGPQWPGFTS